MSSVLDSMPKIAYSYVQDRMGVWQCTGSKEGEVLGEGFSKDWKEAKRKCVHAVYSEVMLKNSKRL